MIYHALIFYITVALEAFMSFFTFGLFGLDKKRSVSKAPRVKEKTLLLHTALFGAFGSMLGMLVFHHKTNKIYFSIVIWVSFVLQIALIAYTAYIKSM